MVAVIPLDTVFCGKIFHGTMIPGTDQTSNKPGKIDRTESALNPMHSEPSARCSNSGATGTARPGCPLFASSSRYCAQVRVGGRAEHVRWPVREWCGSGREGSLSGEGTTGWAHPALTGPSACAVIHSCRDAFGNHPRVQILAVSTVVTHQNSSSSPAPLARWAGHMPLSRPSHLRSHVSA